MTNLKKQGEDLLLRIKKNKQALESIEAQYNEELEAVRSKYYDKIECIKNDIRQAETELEKYARKNKYQLFIGDIADFKNGRLILQIKQAVKRVRNMLENLENLGWEEAIIIEKKVNWNELEKWPDERLIAVGTERVTKETVTYEIK